MLLKRFLQTGIAGLALGGSAMAADPDTVRLGRTESKDASVTEIAAPTDEDTELVRGYHGGGYGGGYRGGYYGGGGYGRSYYGGGYGRSFYGVGFSSGYYGGGYGRSYYGGGYYGGYNRGGGYGGGYSYPSYYSYPTYYSTPSYYYGCSGTEAPTINLGMAPSQPLAVPQMSMPVPAAPQQKVEATETLKVNFTAPRSAIKYAAYGDK